MDEKIALALLYDHNITGLSYRTLAAKYGINRTRIHRMVMSKQNKQGKAIIIKPEKPIAIKVVVSEESALPDDITVLKEELRKARLKIELQDFMLDISSKGLGIDLRKKHGTRRSK